DNAANELGYAVERKAGGEGGFTRVAKLPPDATSYHDTGLSPAERYTYRVRAMNFGNDSSPTKEVEVTMPTPPQTPANCRVAEVTTSRIKLAWEDKSSNEDGYRV